MRTCLVTGGAGFIGSHLVEALVERGDRVRVLDDFSTGTVNNLASVQRKVEIVTGNVTEQDAVAKAMQGVDVVFHHAAMASVPRSIENPIASFHACALGTLVVLDQARRAGVRRLVYAASSSAYGDHPFSSKREFDPLTPLSPYAAGKLSGELLCQSFHHAFGMMTIGLRYFNVFGPRQDPASPYSAVIPIFIAKLLRGEPPRIYGDGEQTRDFIYVANVVHANLLAAEVKGVGGQVVNIGTGRSLSLNALLVKIQRLLGTRLEPVHEPARAGDVRDSLADITRARALLGFEPLVDFDEGLARTVASFANQVSSSAVPSP